MKKTTRFALLMSASFLMAFSMPQCPGQQAMQEHLDRIQASHGELSKKVQAMDGKITPLNNDMNEVKKLLGQMTNVISAQRTGMEQLETQIKDLQAKLAKPAPKAAPKKRH